MVFEFGNSFLIVIILLVFLVDVINCYADDIDHVAEEGCAKNLKHHDDYHLCLILGSKIPEANCHNSGYSPINGIDITSVPRFVKQVDIVWNEPAILSLWEILWRVYDKSLYKKNDTNTWATTNRTKNSYSILSSLISFLFSA